MSDALLERVYQQLRSPRVLVGLDHQQRTLTDLILAAMRDKQSTSVLCLGRPGTGKSACVSAVVSALATKGTAMHVVRLNGHLHAEAHIGLAEVLKQLHDEDCSDEENEVRLVCRVLQRKTI